MLLKSQPIYFPNDKVAFVPFIHSLIIDYGLSLPILSPKPLALPSEVFIYDTIGSVQYRLCRAIILFQFYYLCVREILLKI
ncbi:hypothetical protein SDC9_145958 [bioreactor metagenome]|uniref:Uncharacterized protein n=1 Tax=bioreactor metagenome TaxID=1076179 RepID=A0A645ECD6_9ZZZZ